MLNKQSYSVIVRPIVTEKSSALKAEANKVTFEVKKTANKIDVKTAIEGLSDVSTMIMRGKNARVGQSQGRRSNWKKAIVTLKAGTDLDIFGTTGPMDAADDGDEG